MIETMSHTVPGLHCGHCGAAVSDELTSLQGVSAVEVDLDSMRVTVRGDALDTAAVRAAIGEAGYEVAA